MQNYQYCHQSMHIFMLFATQQTPSVGTQPPEEIKAFTTQIQTHAVVSHRVTTFYIEVNLYSVNMNGP